MDVQSVDVRSVAAGEPLPDLDEVYQWPSGAWLRSMMLTTLDGAVRGPDGLSGSLSCPSDQQIFAQARRFADAVLVGAGTLRAERYLPLVSNDADLSSREGLALSPAPTLVVVSSSLDLSWDDPVFHDSTMRPIVATVESPDADALADEHRNVDVMQLPGDRVDALQLLAALAYRGLIHVVCEGGPTLLAQLASVGLVDEADVTIAPMQVGGGQIETGPPTLGHRMRLAGVIEQDGWLFTRYVRSLSETLMQPDG